MSLFLHSLFHGFLQCSISMNLQILYCSQKLCIYCF